MNTSVDYAPLLRTVLRRAIGHIEPDMPGDLLEVRRAKGLVKALAGTIESAFAHRDKLGNLKGLSARERVAAADVAIASVKGTLDATWQRIKDDTPTISAAAEKIELRERSAAEYLDAGEALRGAQFLARHAKSDRRTIKQAAELAMQGNDLAPLRAVLNAQENVAGPVTPSLKVEFVDIAAPKVAGLTQAQRNEQKVLRRLLSQTSTATTGTLKELATVIGNIERYVETGSFPPVETSDAAA